MYEMSEGFEERRNGEQGYRLGPQWTEQINDIGPLFAVALTVRAKNDCIRAT